MPKKMPQKSYHIYAKEKCIYQNLPESEFLQVWDMLDKFLTVSGAMDKSDITYREIEAH